MRSYSEFPGMGSDHLTITRWHFKKVLINFYFTKNPKFLCFWHSGLYDERTSENKNATLDEFYRRLEAEFAKSPEDYKMEMVVAVVNVTKA